MRLEHITKLGLKDFTIFAGFIGLLIGSLLGIIYTGGGLIIDCFVSLNILSGEDMGTPGLSYGTLLAFGALIGMPLIFGVVGLLIGIIGGLLFNLVAPKVRGIPLRYNSSK